MRPRAASGASEAPDDATDAADAGWSTAVFGAEIEDADAEAERRGRDRRRRAVLLGGAIAVGIGAGAALSLSPPSRAWLIDAQDRVIAAIEARPDHQLQSLQVTGQRRVTTEAVAKAVGIGSATPADQRHALMYDVRDSRARIEALPWVARAEVSIRAPDTLVVRLVEREAAVIWRRGSRLTLLDADGAAIVDAPSGRLRGAEWARLPLIVGDGAAERLAEALGLAARAQEAGLALAGLTRIGQRRWDLELIDGPRVQLPEADPETALETVIAWSRRADLMRRPYQLIDLRLPHAPTARLTEAAAPPAVPSAAGASEPVR